MRIKPSLLSIAAFGFDLVAVAVAWLAAYALRFNGSVPDDFWHGGINALVWVVVIYAADVPYVRAVSRHVGVRKPARPDAHFQGGRHRRADRDDRRGHAATFARSFPALC